MSNIIPWWLGGLVSHPDHRWRRLNGFRFDCEQLWTRRPHRILALGLLHHYRSRLLPHNQRDVLDETAREDHVLGEEQLLHRDDLCSHYQCLHVESHCW